MKKYIIKNITFIVDIDFSEYFIMIDDNKLIVLTCLDKDSVTYFEISDSNSIVNIQKTPYWLKYSVSLDEKLVYISHSS